MPISGWVGFGLLAIVICGIALFIGSLFYDTAPRVITGGLAAVVLFALLVGLHWWYDNTESGKRAMKDQESNFGDGISRRVQVYDMEGDLIKEYEGKFDVEMHDTYILFDDEHGKRHIVYFTTGSVVLDELKEE